MAQIANCKNVLATAKWTNAVGEFSHRITSMPTIQPHAVIVRGINWNGLIADTNLYLLWCNLNNDFIGSFCGGSIAPHFPQTHITPTGPIPNVLEFKLFAPGANGIPVFRSAVTGELAIHLDFVTYAVPLGK